VGIEHLPAERQARWLDLVGEAELHAPAHFTNNGWVIHAFQAAWSAVHLAVSAPVANFTFEAERFAYGLELAVRAGNDTDTVAAIAGSLLGAYFGQTAVPAVWRLKMHGWPSIDERKLTHITHQALSGSKDVWPNIPVFDYSGWGGRYELTQHPEDSGLWLGGVGSLASLPSEVTAVVSLCRVGYREISDHVEQHLEVYLMDAPGDDGNLNAGFVLKDVARAVKALRDAGEVVYLHCVQSQSRTPSVAAAYSMLFFDQDLDSALAGVIRVLPMASPIKYFVEQLKRL